MENQTKLGELLQLKEVNSQPRQSGSGTCTCSGARTLPRIRRRLKPRQPGSQVGAGPPGGCRGWELDTGTHRHPSAIPLPLDKSVPRARFWRQVGAARKPEGEGAPPPSSEHGAGAPRRPFLLRLWTPGARLSLPGLPPGLPRAGESSSEPTAPLDLEPAAALAVESALLGAQRSASRALGSRRLRAPERRCPCGAESLQPRPRVAPSPRGCFLRGARRRGLQVARRPPGVRRGLRSASHPFLRSPALGREIGATCTEASGSRRD
nr:uncharacterized protein LOC127483402 [Oryctolagus cuniculus]